MALISCKECGQTVSNRAFECPHCGYPMRRRTRRRPPKIVYVLIFMGIIIMAYLLAFLMLQYILP